MTQLATMHVSASVRSGIPLTVVVVDVLDLGGINTRHGLGIGDRLLRQIADALRANVRTEDVVGRWSGDKIAVILPGTPLDGLYHELRAHGIDARRVGDCVAPRRAHAAVVEGERAGAAL